MKKNNRISEEENNVSDYRELDIRFPVPEEIKKLMEEGSPEERNNARAKALEILRILGLGGKIVRIPSRSKESEILKLAALEYLRYLGLGGRTLRVPTVPQTKAARERAQMIDFVAQKIEILRKQGYGKKREVKIRIMTDAEILKKAEEKGIPLVVLEHVIYPKAFNRIRAREWRSRKKDSGTSES